MSRMSAAALHVKLLLADLNTTAFGKVNTEILWYLTLPFLFSVGKSIGSPMAEFIIGGWLGALCAKTGVEFVRYRTDRRTEFTPQEKAAGRVLDAQAQVIKQSAPSEAAAIVQAVKLPPPQVADTSKTEVTNNG